MIPTVHQADSPLLISVPHAGLELPAGVGLGIEAWAELPDTDWHVDRLVDFAPRAGAGLLVARCSRYVVDLNRPADDQPLYARNGPGLVPTRTFAGETLYPEGEAPDDQEKSRRVEAYWQPYHEQLARQLESIRSRFGFAVLLDAHSIASQVPSLFEGTLPDLNLGTFDGQSCAPELQRAVQAWLEQAEGFTHVVNGRFKGGYITRHYGRPDDRIHALQLEIAQACYLDESQPQHWDEVRARALKQQLRRLIDQLQAWRPA